MKIIRLATFLDFGGVERRLEIISHICDEHEWVFCAINKGGTAEDYIRKQGKRVVCFRLSYKIPSILTLYKLYKFYKKEKPDVVHTSGAEANFHGVLAAKLAGVPVVVSEEIGIPSQGRMAKRIFSFIYALSDYVVGNSEPVIKYLQKENGVTSKKTVRIPNPMLFKPVSLRIENEDDVFRIVSVSRLEPVKNLESVLRVVAQLISEGFTIQYTIVGDGSHISELKALASSLGLEEKVVFAGYQNNPLPYLQAADLYVLTSFTEGFSNSLAEAMYSGTPSLSTKVGAAEEIISDSKNGWLVQPDDDSDLKQKIKTIIGIGKEERNQIGQIGKQTITENYSLEKHAGLLMQVYQK
ncbi:glycosyltransferase [Flavobacterium sp.]|uniref:glycosyltransferase n=1 Tax=Flavobacterium sp. TaxID=239 RepID=UPI0028BE3569|nr:glycosyltransferase [Flavobacterium sp.]